MEFIRVSSLFIHCVFAVIVIKNIKIAKKGKIHQKEMLFGEFFAIIKKIINRKCF